MEFSVNTDESIKLVNKLEILRKSALPSAVRGTLNSLAMDVKKDTMPKEAKDNFTIRQNSFFQARSKVNFAKGNDLNKMQSEIGFNSRGGKDEQAVEDLEQQEHGGKIKGRAFLAMNSARVSKSNAKIVRRNLRISAIKNLADRDNVDGVNDGQKLIKSIVFIGKDGFVLSGNILYRVDSIDRSKRSKRFKLTAIYTYEEGRSVKIKKATHFMRTASERSYRKATYFFEKEAIRQFNRVL